MKELQIDVSALPEQHRAWVADVVAQVAVFLRDGEEVTPIAFVRTIANTLDLVATHFNSTEDKDAFAHFLRSKYYGGRAEALLFVSESWALKTDKLAEHDAIIEKYGSIGQSPFAVDSVMFTLETASLAYWCVPRILPWPPSKKRRRIESPVKFRVAGSAGRFSHLLSDAEDKQTKH